eukprot:1150813-Pelagomonas_calceolata.AAC.2
MDGERCKRCTTLATSQWLGSSSIVCTHCRTSCRRFGNYQEWAVTSFPDCAEAWLLVGAAAYQLGDAAGCVAACDRAIMLDPNLIAMFGALRQACRNRSLAHLFHVERFRKLRQPSGQKPHHCGGVRKHGHCPASHWAHRPGCCVLPGAAHADQAPGCTDLAVVYYQCTVDRADRADQATGCTDLAVVYYQCTVWIVRIVQIKPLGAQTWLLCTTRCKICRSGYWMHRPGCLVYGADYADRADQATGRLDLAIVYYIYYKEWIRQCAPMYRNGLQGFAMS